MCSNMRAFPTPPAAMLGSLYGARAQAKLRHSQGGLRFANPPYVLIASNAGIFVARLDRSNRIQPMRQPMRFTAEQKFAGEMLLKSAAIATPLLAEFSAWLMAGLGAAFALFIANLDSVTKYVYAYSFRWALIWFCVSFLSGLIARLLAVSVASGLSANEVFASKAKELEAPNSKFSFPAFFHLYFSGLLLPYRCLALRALNKVKQGDLMTSSKLTAKTSQAQAILVLCQILCATISVTILTTGIKV